MPFTPKPLSDSPLWLHWLPCIAFCVAILHFFWFLNSHASNIPFQDDIPDLLLFVTQVEKADSIWIALEAGFRQYNDHRVGATRLLVYGIYLVEGDLNFRTLTLVANLALPLLLLLFYIAVSDNKFRWIYLLIVSLLLLNLKIKSLLFMSQAAFAYFWVFLYAFATIFTLHKITLPKFLLAAIFCTLSSFTLASGQLAWLLGLASLVHQALLSKPRSFRYPLAWLMIATATLLLWYLGFVSDTTKSPSPEMLAVLTDYVGNAPLSEKVPRYISFFFAITGSALVDSSALWASMFGFAMLALLLYFSFTSWRQGDIRLLLCCWFAVGSLAALTAGRALMISPESILQARYNFFAAMLLCPLTLLVLTRFTLFRTHAAYIVIALSLSYNVSHWRQPQESLFTALNALYSAFNRDFYPVTNRSGKAKIIVHEAIANKIYYPPCKPYPACNGTATL